MERKAGEPRRPNYLLPLLRLAVETGMRKSELRGLRWGNLNRQASTVQLPDTKHGYPREVPLSPAAMTALLSQGGTHRELVFPVSVPELRHQWSRLLADCEIAGLHFHDLRHEAISRQFEMGLSVPEVALISGHRDPRQLFRYTHPRASDIANKLA